MDTKTLLVILGHASVSFTMDTYAHVLTSHKVESMALMEELFDMGQALAQEVSYPVITTPLATGGFLFTAPDFPQVQFSSGDLYQSIQEMKERIQEELLINLCPPEPTPAHMLVLEAGQLGAVDKVLLGKKLHKSRRENAGFKKANRHFPPSFFVRFAENFLQFWTLSIAPTAPANPSLEVKFNSNTTVKADGLQF